MPLLYVALLLWAGALSGCSSLLNPTLLAMAREQQNPLPSAVPKDAVEFEVFFIERPTDDPLTGETLWSELDQIASVDAAIRERMRSNGLRFGITGRTYPYALQALTSRVFDEGAGRRTTRQRYQTPSGITHQFPCGEMPNPSFVKMVTSDGPREFNFEKGQGVIRCRVEKSHQGWATLEILPEIHHGDKKMRHGVSSSPNGQWDWNGRQEIYALYQQRFSVTLNEGESIVLGSIGDSSDTAGARMFRSNETGQPMTRLVVIRLKSLGQVTPTLVSER